MKYLLLFIPFLSFGQENLQLFDRGLSPSIWWQDQSKTRTIQHQTDLTKYCDCDRVCDPHVIHTDLESDRRNASCVSIDDCLHNWVETDNRRGMYGDPMISCAVYHGPCGCPDKWKDIKKICKNCGLHFREWETCSEIQVEKEDTYDDVLRRFYGDTVTDLTIEAGEGVSIEREGDILTITVDEWDAVDTFTLEKYELDTTSPYWQSINPYEFDLQECILIMMDIDEPYVWWQRGYIQMYLTKESEFYDLDKNPIDPLLIFDFKLD